MIDAIVDAAVEPFKHTIGWQAFAYGVTGKIILIYAKNFVAQYSEGWQEAAEESEEEVEESAESSE